MNKHFSAYQGLITNKKRKVARAVPSPSRNLPYLTLSDDERKQSFLLIFTRQMLSHKYSRLIARFEAEDKNLKLEIHKLMKDIKLEGDNINDDKMKGRDKCAHYLSETVRSMTLHFNDKSNRCRYSPHIIDLSLPLYLRNNASYDHLRGTSIVCSPHHITLQKIYKYMTVLTGLDPTIYLILKDHTFTEKGGIVGHVMLDNIKLKNSIAWNCMNNEVTEFNTEDLNTINLLEHILSASNKKDNKNKHLDVYANQWRFRSTTNLTHNSSFYFNLESLNDIEITKQFLDVLTSYEILGIKIMGIVSDGRVEM